MALRHTLFPAFTNGGKLASNLSGIPSRPSVVPALRHAITCGQLTSSALDAAQCSRYVVHHMEAPPPVLAGLYVVEYAEADTSIVFEQRRTLNVDGQWLGRLPCLAICQIAVLPRLPLQRVQIAGAVSYDNASIR